MGLNGVQQLRVCRGGEHMQCSHCSMVAGQARKQIHAMHAGGHPIAMTSGAWSTRSSSMHAWQPLKCMSAVSLSSGLSTRSFVVGCTGMAGC